MSAILETVERAGRELLDRASGPLSLRLLIQPLVAASLAVVAGWRDERRRQTPFLWTIFTDPDSRRRLIRSGWKDVGMAFLVGIAVDAVYQAIALHTFRLAQALLVATTLTLVPYCLLRGPVSRLVRRARSDA